MSAEQAYLFRHAILREVAYGLQLPMDRAALHAVALDVLEPGGDPAELARHAREAQADPAREVAMQQLELGFLRKAAARALLDWRPGDAMAHARRALELPCATTDGRIGAQCLLVTTAMMQQRLALAHSEVEEALEICRRHNDAEGLPAMLFNAGLICHKLNKPGAAGEFNRELLALTRHRPQSLDHARALKQRGVLLRMEDPEQAAASLTQALEVMRAVGDEREIAGVLLDRGLHHAASGAAELARGDYTEAIALLRGHRDPLRLANLKHSLAQLHATEGDHRTALVLAREAAGIARAAATPAMLASALEVLGRSLQALGENEAAAVLCEAKAIRAELGEADGR